jgi:creatinine amidohydrolase
LLLLATYWGLGARPWETDSMIQQREMGHACEWETSMILRLDPALVGDYRGAIPVPMTASFAPAARGWITKDRSERGHIGSPHQASAEKGETLFRLFADDVVRFLERVIEWDGASWSV